MTCAALLPCLALALAAQTPAPLARSVRPAPQQPASQDAAFATASEAFLEGWWELHPDQAIGAGYYRTADRLPAPDATYREAVDAFVTAWTRKLAAFDPAALDSGHASDLAILKTQLAATQWYQDTFRDWVWNPADYNVGESFSLLLETPYAPLEERLRTVSSRLAQVPAYYQTALKNLDRPTLEHTRLGVEQNLGSLEVLGPACEAKVRGSALPQSEKDLLLHRLEAARAAIQGYADGLRALAARLEAKGEARSFRIGKAFYERQFAFDIQSSRTGEATYRKALEEKERLLATMSDLAGTLWPTYFKGVPMPSDRLERIARVIDKLSEHHCAPADFFTAIRDRIPKLQAWVASHHLVALDSSSPLQVRETPPYLRGSAGASVSGPGPYDPKATTYYNVTPLTDLPPEQAESYLREYNDWTLQILSIHEAMPGHYVQGLHANRTPSRIKAIFGNGAMVEGWAVYGELLMMESGYDNSPEMWLLYSKWYLRSVCNTILDYSVHVLDMDRDAAMKLLTREAFQTRAEAEEKWTRATLSSVQLASYFSGFSDIHELRRLYRQRLGKRFDLQAFNDRFLSYGNAPVGVIRHLMEEEDRRNHAAARR